MVRLAGPVVLAELGWMSMGVVDTIMVGRLGPEAIGAVAVGNALFHALSISGVGLLLGLDTLVSRAFGAGDLEDCHHSLLQAIYISLAISPLLMGVIFLTAPLLQTWGLHPDVLGGSIAYMRVVVWSTFPLLLFTALRRYLQGMGLVRATMVILVSANLINVLANWLLIFGRAGFPVLGVEGAAWATFFSRLYMCLGLMVYIAYREHPEPAGLAAIPLKPDLKRIGRLLKLGLPAAMQIGLEVGVFATATTLAGTLGPVEVAAHQIALNCAALSFMVPLGVSAAGAVRVGQALGRRDLAGARRAGWTALFLGAGFMLCMGVLFLVAPRPIIRIYTTDAAVISTGVSLLALAAAFQLFDGVQVVATGILRGAGDTRTPMLSSLLCYWLLGLPLGYYLCFSLGWGVQGIWVGLSLGLITVGIILLFVWSRWTSWSLRESYAGD